MIRSFVGSVLAAVVRRLASCLRSRRALLGPLNEQLDAAETQLAG